MIYLDLDGVLANFDKRASEVVGMDHYRFSFIHGQKEFWRRLSACGDFFGSLELMPDARQLLQAVEGHDVSILTALPSTDKDLVEEQKREWVAKHISPDMHVTCCMSVEKPNYCNYGDVLIDDRAVNEERWILAGGHFILHTTALNSIEKLGSLGIGPRA
jgi:hypothetical protein